MTIKRLSILKGITAWGGVITTLIGVADGLCQGVDVWSYAITLAGVALTTAGNLIGIAQAQHQRAEKEADTNRIKELTHRLDNVDTQLERQKSINSMSLINSL